MSSPSQDPFSNDIAVALPNPQFATPLLQISTTDTTILPFELVDLLNHAYFLHVLSTEPQRVLPPGKSLLSVLSGTHMQNENEDADSVKERVRDVFHRAFWDEATESLSNPTPSSQLPRLKRLYDDLHVALSPLLPKDHTVLITLSSPLSPTSAPLLSAITHLRETLASLRERCAPARDSSVDQLLHNLDNSPAASSTKELAELIVETVKSILNFADVMKSDLSQFVLGSMNEKQLKRVITEQAISLERKLALDLWTLERVRDRWAHWVNGPIHVDPVILANIPPERKWVAKLTETLGSATPVFCRLPTKARLPDGTTSEVVSGTPDCNELPPPLFFCTPSLLYIQNYLQALVVAASLYSLVPRSRGSAPHLLERDTFMGRTWSLLKAELDGEPGDTKIINLADEVVQAHRLATSGTTDEEKERWLRTAVDRILHTHDPVFILLQKRLLEALLLKLVETKAQPRAPDTVPDRLRTGSAKNVHVPLGLPQDGGEVEVRDVGELFVKGFDDPVLAKAAREVAGELRRCIEWTIDVWGDLIQ